MVHARTLHFQCLEKLQAEREPKSSALLVSTITVLSSQYFCELDHLCQVCSTCTRGSREIYAKKV